MTRKRITEKEIVVSPAAGTAPARRKTTSTAAPRVRRPVNATAAPVATDLSTETVAAQAAPAVAASYQPGPAEIAALAYLYWEARGCQGGSPEADWLRAEQELRSR